MKKLALVLIAVFAITACSSKYDPIKTYVETWVDGSTVDLKFKGLTYEDVRFYTYSDSLEYLENEFFSLVEKKKKVRDSITIKAYAKVIYLQNMAEGKHYQDIINYGADKWESNYKKYLEEWYEDTLRVYNRNIIYDTSCKGTDLEPMKLKINNIKSNPNEPYGLLVKVSYKIFNPLINSEQTIEKVFLMDINKTKVIRSIND